MPEVTPAPSEALSPQAQLIQMAWAHQISSLVRVAAELKLADHLAEGSKNAEQLAQLTSTHAPSLYRVMRTLASLRAPSPENPWGRTLERLIPSSWLLPMRPPTGIARLLV